MLQELAEAKTKMEAEIKSLRIAVAAADEAAAHASEEATTETAELVTLRTRLAEASTTAERQNEPKFGARARRTFYELIVVILQRGALLRPARMAAAA